MKQSLLLAGIFLLFANTLAVAQSVSLQEAPPTTRVQLVEPDATRVIQPGQKIGRLTTLNLTQPYVLQRLTERTYWFQRQFYGATFYVGNSGVLVLDAPRGEHLLQAIRQVTNLPVTAIVYSHYDGDHMGDTQVFVNSAERAAVPLRIIANQASAQKMNFLSSRLPRPTDIIAWPKGSFMFEAIKVEFQGFAHAAQTDDHGVWLLVGERILHATDLINPD